jgi:hypothetical protein
MNLLLQTQLQQRRVHTAKRYEKIQSNLYLQRAIRHKFFSEVHRSMKERAGEVIPDNDQYRPFLAQQRAILLAARVL